MTECVRNSLNWSSFELSDKFDNVKFDPEKFRQKMEINGPKLVKLFENIKSIDSLDFKKDKKLYKHYIFTDLKKSHGVKLLISAFISAGYTFCLEKKGDKLALSEAKLMSDDESKFVVLSSSVLYKSPFTPKNTKQTLEIFNKRPENIYGDLCRFIIIDSGFKEGIDLFDVKYAHIFEEQMTSADLTQALGRGLRNCGQKGLPFKKNKGWELKAFIYTNTFDDHTRLLNREKSVIKHIKEKDSEATFNQNLISELENIMKDASVDKLLTETLHKNKGSGINIKKIALIAIPVIILAGQAALQYKAYKVKKGVYKRYTNVPGPDGKKHLINFIKRSLKIN